MLTSTFTNTLLKSKVVFVMRPYCKVLPSILCRWFSLFLCTIVHVEYLFFDLLKKKAKDKIKSCQVC